MPYLALLLLVALAACTPSEATLRALTGRTIVVHIVDEMPPFIDGAACYQLRDGSAPSDTPPCTLPSIHYAGGGEIADGEIWLSRETSFIWGHELSHVAGETDR